MQKTGKFRGLKISRARGKSLKRTRQNGKQIYNFITIVILGFYNATFKHVLNQHNEVKSHLIVFDTMKLTAVRLIRQTVEIWDILCVKWQIVFKHTLFKCPSYPVRLSDIFPPKSTYSISPLWKQSGFCDGLIFQLNSLYHHKTPSLTRNSKYIRYLKDDLVRDQALASRSSSEFQRQRRLIQNTMDAARYLSPELQNFCNFIIPLGTPPRRILSVVTHATLKPHEEGQLVQPTNHLGTNTAN